MKDAFYKEFINQSIYRINHNTFKIENCLLELNENEIWLYPNEHLNSVGNLIVHLCGNIAQYILSSIGEADDIRDREMEFSITGGYSNIELIEKLHTTIESATAIIKTVNPENLLRKRIVQGSNYTGIGIIIQVTEHYAYHTGQIIFLTKLLKNIDLGFYKNVDLNQRNKL